MIALALLLTLSAISERDASGKPTLRSETVVVRYADTGEVVLSKNPNVVRPIASVTKLLSGLILASQAVDREQQVVLLEDDKDRLKWSRSRLPVRHRYELGRILQSRPRRLRQSRHLRCGAHTHAARHVRRSDER